MERVARERAAQQDAFDRLPAPVWWRDASLRIIGCNRAYALAVDATPETALAEGRMLGGSAVADRIDRLAHLALTGGTPQSEARHVVIAGARRLFEFTEAPLADGGTVGIALDVTDREDAQAELARHITAQDEVLENLQTAMAVYGPDKRLKFFNAAFQRLWKLDRHWLETQPDYGEVLEALRERRRLQEQVNFRAFKDQQLALFTTLLEPLEELTYIPDGTTLRTRIVPHPLGGLLFTHEDVTDALVLERSYNTLIAVQRETLDNLYEGVAVLGSDLRVKLSNPSYARIWRVPPDLLASEPHINDILDQTREFFDDDGDWPGFKERLIARLTDRVARSGRMARADGTVLDYAQVPLPDGAVMLSYIDVTDSMRVENALRERTEALEAADRLKTEFISNVSYELRTPLNTITGFTEILANQYFGPLNPRQMEYCSGISASAERLLNIINDILDLASLEAGRLTLERAPVDLKQLVDGVAKLMGEWANSRLLSITVDCPADAGVADIDERRMRQALCNLVSNAIKFTPPGGSIALSVQVADDHAEFAVRDTGVGIAPQDQERVFREFERGSNREAQRAGAGLGLSLVKRFVELHGGTVTITSRPGAGTTVTCRVPLAAPAAQAA
ncbi:MAG: PAS-domain containing protein [Alphaproteobacteria bacterium]|nr:PAS-domain containing protein [Alphaproteobacteria bacterium]